jgi:hypothetical protein
MELFSHIKFRYTFNFPGDLFQDMDESGLTTMIPEIVSTFIEKMDAVYVTCGIEDLDKFGEKTHPHLHIHCITPKKVDAIRKAMTKIFKDMDESRKGNCLYGLSQVKDILDQNRLLRYPFKQGRRGLGDVSCIQHLNKLPPDFNYVVERECAIEEWERLVVINRQKREKSLNPNTFEKFEMFMEKNSYVPVDVLDCCRYLDRFYMQEKSSMNRKTMAGYAVTYSRTLGLITEDENARAIYANI